MSAKWITTTEERYYEMLGVLPPAAYGNNGSFQVGEPMDHRWGRPTFASFKIEGETYYESEDALTFAEFKAECGPAQYCYVE